MFCTIYLITTFFNFQLHTLILAHQPSNLKHCLVGIPKAYKKVISLSFAHVLFDVDQILTHYSTQQELSNGVKKVEIGWYLAEILPLQLFKSF